MSDNPVLERGDRGESVKQMQEILNQMGYDLGSSGVDGLYDEETETAVKQFQSEMNQQFPEAHVLVDGKVGNQTWAFLHKNKS